MREHRYTGTRVHVNLLIDSAIRYASRDLTRNPWLLGGAVHHDLASKCIAGGIIADLAIRIAFHALK